MVLHNSESEENSNCLQDEDMDVPEIIEEIIEVLLSGLRDTVCLKGEILLCKLIAFLCKLAPRKALDDVVDMLSSLDFYLPC